MWSSTAKTNLTSLHSSSVERIAGMSAIAWESLRAQATLMTRRAYVPYSRFPVGAAALTTSGRMVFGCNVENAAYGVVLCAECGLVSSLLAGREGDQPVMDAQEPGRELLVALSCVDANGTPITPCGRCRQLLYEHAAPDMLIDMADADPVPLTALLPYAFGGANLAAVESSAQQLNSPRSKGKS